MKIKVATANIKGFGPMIQRKVRSDVETMQATGASLLATQEMWLPRYKRALRNGLTGWRHVTQPRRGTVASFDPKLWIEVNRETFELHPAVWGVCDKRIVAVVELKHRISGRYLAFMSVHPAPKATRKTKSMQRKAAEARRLGWLRIRRYVSGKAMPVIIAGDLNDSSDVFGDSINGKSVKYVKHGIDQIVFVDGKNYRWTLDRAKKRVLRLFSDHKGLYVEASLSLL